MGVQWEFCKGGKVLNFFPTGANDGTENKNKAAKSMNVLILFLKY